MNILPPGNSQNGNTQRFQLCPSVGVSEIRKGLGQTESLLGILSADLALPVSPHLHPSPLLAPVYE